MTITSDLSAMLYLAAAVLFILGLKDLTSPRTAGRGNYLAIAGMIIGVATTALNPAVASYTIILAGVAIGAVIGITLAMRIQMTAMPQLVAALHSFVGLAAVLVAIGTFLNRQTSGTLDSVLLIEIFVGTFIGAITFTGSVIAFGKLQAIISPIPVRLPARHLINIVLVLSMLGFGVDFVINVHFGSLLTLTAIAMILGVLLIIPIGGADMPVVISMLNSYSGWTAAATGFTLQNNLLIITGALVGFSGAILSYIMCKAMNRSFLSVILGGLGEEEETEVSPAGIAEGQTVKAASIVDATYLMEDAEKVIIVPGYGMAVAQAQHALKEMMDVLVKRGVEVKFAIHPVAGRMPGHMNVLLAEADISYDYVFEMDEINPEFPTADVALVVGANDVTNPAARQLKSSPIYGMPILDVSRAQHVFVIKRSMRPGYSGIDNLLYYQDNCSMIFADAKEACSQLATALKQAG